MTTEELLFKMQAGDHVTAVEPLGVLLVISTVRISSPHQLTTRGFNLRLATTSSDLETRRITVLTSPHRASASMTTTPSLQGAPSPTDVSLTTERSRLTAAKPQTWSPLSREAQATPLDPLRRLHPPAPLPSETRT